MRKRRKKTTTDHDAHADCGLIVFLRFPVKGKVKTRIAATSGDDAALAVYNELTTLTLNVASTADMPVYLFYEGQLPLDKENHLFHYILQSDGDLGEKMLSAFNYVLRKHKRAIIIGSDCPYLEPSDLLTARDQLNSVDVALGPTEDGGFYLMGCNDVLPFLLSDIAWSNSSVLEEIIQRIIIHNKSYSLLRKLADIDYEDDWLKYKRDNL